jgi:hypothetical protein
VLLLWVAAFPAADYVRYLEWARAALSANIFMLSGDTLSPFGVPFSFWEKRRLRDLLAAPRRVGP